MMELSSVTPPLARCFLTICDVTNSVVSSPSILLLTINVLYLIILVCLSEGLVMYSLNVVRFQVTTPLPPSIDIINYVTPQMITHFRIYRLLYKLTLKVNYRPCVLGFDVSATMHLAFVYHNVSI